jgi:hypothetical protein
MDACSRSHAPAPNGAPVVGPYAPATTARNWRSRGSDAIWRKYRGTNALVWVGAGHRNHPFAYRLGDSLRPIANPKSLAGVGDVVIDGAFRQPQRQSDLSRRFACGDPFKALQLPRRERTRFGRVLSQARSTCDARIERNEQRSLPTCLRRILPSALRPRLVAPPTCRWREDNLTYMPLLF